MTPVARDAADERERRAAPEGSPDRESFHFDTLPELLLQVTAANHRPDALNYPAGDGWVSLSHDELRERVMHLALGLVDLGLRPGEPVGLIAPSSPWWISIDLAIQAAGGVSVPLFKRISVESFTHEIRDSGMRFLFVGNPDEVPMAFQHAGPGVTLITFWFSGKHPEFERLLERGRAHAAREPGSFEELCRRVRENDLATIIYTSGSTGLPKGVELTQRNLVSQVRACPVLFDADPAVDRCLSALPPEHIFERMVLYFYLASGLPVYFVDDPKRITEYMKKVRPTIMTAVPRILEKVFLGIREKTSVLPGIAGMLARAAVRRAQRRPAGARRALLDRVYDRLVYRKLTEALGGSLRFLICGSARLDPEVARLLINIGVPVYEGYGLTEASPVIAANGIGSRKPGTVGKPFPGVEVRIGPDGEILARGPNIMRGYHNEPTATAEVLTPDGWLRTGDLGSIDDEGYLVITGRRKEMFKKSTGEYVPPGPIEQALSRIPWIDNAVVIADGRICVVALLFPDPAGLGRLKESAGLANLDERHFLESSYLRSRTQAEIDGINAHLHHAERVERFAILDHAASPETGELTPTLKKRRFAIEERYAGVIEELYRSVGGWK